MDKAFLALTSDLCCILTQEGTILAANHRHWEALLGWRATELDQKNLLDFQFGPDRETFRAALARACDSPEVVEVRSRAAHLNGTVQTILWKMSCDPVERRVHCLGAMVRSEFLPMSREDGVAGGAGTERDEDIRRNLHFLAALLDNMPACVYAKDLDGRYFMANEGFISSVGLTRRSMVGRTDAELFGPEMAKACGESDRLTLLNGGPTQSEERVAFPDGERVFLSVKFPLRHPDGQIYAICGISTDITERKRAEEAIEAERARAIYSAKMATLGEMAAGIAHEINNPLAIINMRASEMRLMLKHGAPSETAMLESCERIEATSLRISKIVRGLRSFAKDGTLDPLQSVSLETVLNDSLELCQQRFRSNNVQLEVRPIPTEVVLRCRPVQLAQVLLNLLNNAYDAVQELDEKWVRIDFAHSERAVELSVTDSGPGIPAELRAKVMQPFFSTKGPGRGTGLGLSISRGIVESHGGRLWLDSDSTNTRFVIELPQGRTEPT